MVGSGWRDLVLAVLAVALVACGTPDSQAGPDFGKAAAGLAVIAVTPSSAGQDTTLDVQITGSGFDRGSTAALLLAGVEDARVHTNSTRYVSTSSLVANVTIAKDAATTLYDVAVTTGGGKKGIGSDLFAVYLKGGAPQVIALMNPSSGGSFSTPSLAIMAADGSNLNNLVRIDGGSPSWAPGGLGTAAAPWRLAYQAKDAAGARRLYRIDVTIAGGVPKASNVQDLSAFFPTQHRVQTLSWSPLGDEIAFSTDGSGLGVPDSSAMWVVPAAGGPPSILYQPARSAYVVHPTWSRDGQCLAFLETDTVSAQRVIKVIQRHFDSTCPGGIAVGPGFSGISAIDWGRTADVLVFSARTGATLNWFVYTVPASGGTPQQLTSGMYAAWSPDDRFIVTTASAGIMRYTVASGAITTLQRNLSSSTDWRR